MESLTVRFREFNTLFRSRLSWRIVFWIFICIAAIEAILLVPSTERRKQELLSLITEVSSSKIDWILETYPQATGQVLLQETRKLDDDPMLDTIVGGAVYDPKGKLVGTFGEPPTMTFGQADDGGQLYRRGPKGDRYDVAWIVSRPSGTYTIILNHSAAIQAELFAYVLRIAGMVLIIATFVTLAMILILGSLVITPILNLRRDLARVGESVHNNQLNLTFDSTATQRQDELGEVITTFQQMYHQIRQEIYERKQAETELRYNNQQMQQYIQEVDRVSAAAAAVEGGTFHPESLADVAQRTDELGQLARVFQTMAAEIKQRENQLKQQVAELKIEIDQQKREREVSQITQSGYFQELQEEMEAVNLDEFWS